MKKVAVIGAGFVGGSTAMRIAESGIAGVILVDVLENIARAKAYDIEDARYCLGVNSHIEGTGDFSAINHSDIVVVAAGFARKPGMTREDLLLRNASCMEEVCKHIVKFSPDSIVVVVSNPLDAMTYLAFRKLGFPRERVFGMGASLDSSRFANLISKKVFVGTEFIRCLVIGSHGETMLPLARLAQVRQKPLTQFLSEAEIAALTQATRQRGAEIVSLYGSGSAYFSPSAAVLEIIRAVFYDETKEIPVSAVLEGEYNLHEVAIGVPAQIGARGMQKVIEIELTLEEKEAFNQSALSIRDSLKQLNL